MRGGRGRRPVLRPLGLGSGRRGAAATEGPRPRRAASVRGRDGPPAAHLRDGLRLQGQASGSGPGPGPPRPESRSTVGGSTAERRPGGTPLPGAPFGTGSAQDRRCFGRCRFQARIVGVLGVVGTGHVPQATTTSGARPAANAGASWLERQRRGPCARR